jgi:hypothetical protein
MVHYTLISFEVLFSFMLTRKLINRLCPQSNLLSDLRRVDSPMEREQFGRTGLRHLESRNICVIPMAQQKL